MATRAIEVLVLAGDAYSELGTFAGDTPLESRVLPQLTLPARRFFPREG